MRLLQDGDYAMARFCLLCAVQQVPDNAEYQRRLAECLWRLNQRDEPLRRMNFALARSSLSQQERQSLRQAGQAFNNASNASSNGNHISSIIFTRLPTRWIEPHHDSGATSRLGCC
jgi:hypothetical protein